MDQCEEEKKYKSKDKGNVKGNVYVLKYLSTVSMIGSSGRNVLAFVTPAGKKRRWRHKPRSLSQKNVPIKGTIEEEDKWVQEKFGTRW